MLEKIINSHTRLAILACLFNDPGCRYYARELVKALDLDPANVHKELASLVQGGFVKEEKSGRQKFFSADQASPFFIGLKEIFSHYRSNA